MNNYLLGKNIAFKSLGYESSFLSSHFGFHWWVVETFHPAVHICVSYSKPYEFPL